MAETTLDLSPQTHSPDERPDRRSAKFRRPELPDGTDLDNPGQTRRASYRPREEVAERRDVVEELRRRLERDATHTPDNRELVAEAVLAA